MSSYSLYSNAYGASSYARCAQPTATCSAYNSGCGMKVGGERQGHSWGAMNPQCATAAGADNQNVYNFGNYLNTSRDGMGGGTLLAKYDGGRGCGSVQDLDNMFPAVLGQTQMAGVAINVAGASPDTRVGGVDSLAKKGGCVSLESQYGGQGYGYGSSNYLMSGYGVAANLPC